jgi:hypothetical protein
VWIIIVSGVCAVAAVAAVASRRATDLSNMGYVSERWLSEYRAAHSGP